MAVFPKSLDHLKKHAIVLSINHPFLNRIVDTPPKSYALGGP
jgi:hypothetical protein